MTVLNDKMSLFFIYKVHLWLWLTEFFAIQRNIEIDVAKPPYIRIKRGFFMLIRFQFRYTKSGLVFNRTRNNILEDGRRGEELKGSERERSNEGENERNR